MDQWSARLRERELGRADPYEGEDKHEPFRKSMPVCCLKQNGNRLVKAKNSFRERNAIHQTSRSHAAVLATALLRRISEPYDGPRLIVSSSRRRAEEFSSDLYDALCHLELDVPLFPKERGYLHLAYLFIAESNEAFGKQIVGFRNEAGVLLEEAKWPGNLSQLRKRSKLCP
ncbi:hypothetical protein PO124_11635 [Bacillus licheniformis]|nr:hypothetical protein [Bacillus licheniformis]